MAYHSLDTIAAIGTAAGGAARGMVRVSGPSAIACLAQSFSVDQGQPDLKSVATPRMVVGSFQTTKNCQAAWQTSQAIPCDAYLWPKMRSYTRQPTVELHTFGSPPLLESVLRTLCNNGARVAEPGEFTLRAFLAGRIDLTQAEAVLGVIDATGEDEFRQSLSQLAGGLSRPLGLLRERLLSLLAELEAGLDFAEEEIEFISRDNLRAQLDEAQQKVDEAIQQLTTRGSPLRLPCVVLVGKPNVGKSSLFNAVLDLCGAGENRAAAIVSDVSGTTRDYVTARIVLGGVDCELVDTAGEDASVHADGIGQAAQAAMFEQRLHSAVRVHCVDLVEAHSAAAMQSEGSRLTLLTKADLLDSNFNPAGSILACSSVTGEGLLELAGRLRKMLVESLGSGAAALTSARCGESLRLTRLALERSMELLDQVGGEELIAAEIRDALHHLGQVVGAIVTDDILDRIFSQFCIGK